MPPGSKRPYHHGDLRNALLEAAEAELIDTGVEHFSLRAVAKRAGVSHAAPAHHFGDTDGLLTALAAVGMVRFREAMRRRQAGVPNDPTSQFLASGMGYLDFARDNPALFKLIFGSDRPHHEDPDLVRESTEAFMVLVTDVAGMTERNPMESEDGRTDVMLAWASVHGLANLLIAGRVHAVHFGAETDREATDRMLSGILERAIPPSAKR